ncbi:MAG TPA: HEAT repeat domain-containing protein [Candidatus Eisenbacteria bacterium]|nr:HEAT repeat domain-containing protein [Candidatus Eisenbacteria bacterium]
MIPADFQKQCQQVAPLLVFYVCGEADEKERVLIEQHLGVCAACREQFADERKFQSLLGLQPRDADRLDSSGILLSQCRSELAETLDDIVRPPVLEKTPVFGAFRRWMALRPVWSGAALVFLGAVVGVQSSQWYAARDSSSPLDLAVDVRPGPHLSDDQLSKMAVAGINFMPAAGSGTQNVRVQLNAEQPVELSGSVDNSDVRRVLTYVVKSGDRFNPGMRLDCLDALKARAGDAEVRNALLTAARKDQNPAVRLKALEALRDSTADKEVREALLDALKHDTNPGVRVEAVNLLVGSLEQAEDAGEQLDLPALADLGNASATPVASGGEGQGASLDTVIQELELLQHRDPSRYVRLRSAAALRQLSARGEQ